MKFTKLLDHLRLMRLWAVVLNDFYRARFSSLVLLLKPGFLGFSSVQLRRWAVSRARARAFARRGHFVAWRARERITQRSRYSLDYPETVLRCSHAISASVQHHTATSNPR